MMTPFASPEGFSDGVFYNGSQEGHWYLFHGDKDALLVNTQNPSVPSQCLLPVARSVFLGTLDGIPLFAGEVASGEVPEGWEWKRLRSLYGILNEAHFSLAGRAMQLLLWDRMHQFCGFCGSPTDRSEKERSRKCRGCGFLHFPKLAPVVMIMIRKEERILLARSPHFPEEVYSVLAGYVDPGETLEQCVAREVYEEVGLKVKNVHYAMNQSWPFSNSLIIGFTCEWESGVIQIDDHEIIDAGWFDVANLPRLPHPCSLARVMIDQLFKG